MRLERTTILVFALLLCAACARTTEADGGTSGGQAGSDADGPDRDVAAAGGRDGGRVPGAGAVDAGAASGRGGGGGADASTCGFVSATVVLGGSVGLDITTPRTCGSDADCTDEERCFLVDSIGICSAPKGVRCAEELSPVPLLCADSDDAGTDPCACDVDAECYVYERICSCQPFLEPRCVSNACRSNADCDPEELCVPGMLHPEQVSSNRCMPVNRAVPQSAPCRRDSECREKPCGRCVFHARIPLQSGPVPTYDGTHCAYPE